MPTNFPKLKFVLSQLSKQTRELIKNLGWIDFGCGPASLGLGLIDELGVNEGNWYQGIESSPFMRSQAKELLKVYAPDIKADFFQSLPHKIEQNQLLVMGNVVNELTAEEVESIVKQVNPRVIIFLDIGTQDVFAKMLRLRDYLLKEDYTIDYPCRTMSSCPMAETTNWCHQKIFVTQDPLLERLGQKIKNDRRTLPFNAFVFVKGEERKSSAKEIRLIRMFTETKFSFSFEGCNNKGELEQYEILKKTLTKDQRKGFKKVNWGELILCGKSEQKGHKIRIEDVSFGCDDD